MAETLRSSFTPDGQRVFLMFDADRGTYRLATRWIWLYQFENVRDACDAFEALEMMDGDLKAASKLIASEIKRVPRYQFATPSGIGRISYLIDCVERRIAGLRPVRCGGKGAIEKWVSA